MIRLLIAASLMGALLPPLCLAQTPTWNSLSVLPTRADQPAVTRGGAYMGFPERFNRYYTDRSWRPSRILYVSPNGNGEGATPQAPASTTAIPEAARPGTLIYFLRGTYQACFNFSRQNSGTYDQPIVLYGERNPNGSLGVVISCCGNRRQSCFNFEAADYVAVDGFELVGGRYGVRSVGAGYAESQHARGIAVVNCRGRDQSHDAFFTGASDWAVWERNAGYRAKSGDGHGIYLSNGSDWNIVRFNELFDNHSSDFQINADPASTCRDVGIPYADPRCDAYAGESEGGQGASDYFLIDSNYFHHGAGPGPNFTSVRRSVIRNNIFGPHPRHNASFWQETDNPRLGSSENSVVHNLFISTGRHGIQFISHSTRNEFANNVLIGVRMSDGRVTSNTSAVLMEVDQTVRANVYRSNLYASGKVNGRQLTAGETLRQDFSAAWFVNFPNRLNHNPNDFTPTAHAPFVVAGRHSAHAPADRNGKVRQGVVDLGPIESR